MENKEAQMYILFTYLQTSCFILMSNRATNIF